MKTKSLMLGAGSALSVLVLAPLAASAATYTTNSITSVVAGGPGQVGIQVTANFSNAPSETLNWVDTAGAGNVLSPNRWGLSVSGDTYDNNWELFVEDPLLLTSLVINGVPGNVVFDRTEPSPGTFGSDVGLTFAGPGGSPVTGVTGTYSNLVALSSPPTAPAGDLYTTLTLTFPGFTNGFNGNVFYRADTDKANTPLITDTTPPTGTPEPSAVLGLLALGLVGRRLGSKAR
jgi:hypothetical protein